MDPGKLIEQKVQENWGKFGSITKPCVYHETGDPVTNPTTGESSYPIISDTELNIIFDEFRFSLSFSPDTKFDDSPIRFVDKIAMFPAADIDIIPKVTDTITGHDGVEWKVLGKGQDPQPGLYTLHVRPISEP